MVSIVCGRPLVATTGHCAPHSKIPFSFYLFNSGCLASYEWQIYVLIKECNILKAIERRLWCNQKIRKWQRTVTLHILLWNQFFLRWLKYRQVFFFPHLHASSKHPHSNSVTKQRYCHLTLSITYRRDPFLSALDVLCFCMALSRRNIQWYEVEPPAPDATCSCTVSPVSSLLLPSSVLE